MNAAETILSVATWLGLALLVAAFLLTVWRVVKGPTLPDRVVALDMLVGIVIGFIALIAIRTGFTLYIDIAIALGLVGFLATVAFARFILASRGRQGAGANAGKASLRDAAPAPDAAHGEAVAAARGSRKKSTAKPAKASARTADKAPAKKSGKASTKVSAGDEVAESVSAVATPARAPAASSRGKAGSKSRGKPGAGTAEKPISEPQGKSIDNPASRPASKSASKSTSKTGSKSAQKSAGKAVTRPGKPAKGE